MKRKIITILCALVASLCLCFGLAACNDKEGGAESGTQSGTIPPLTPPEPDKEEDKTPEPDKEEGGTTPTPDEGEGGGSSSTPNPDEGGSGSATPSNPSEDEPSMPPHVHTYNVQNKCEGCGAEWKYTEGLAFEENDDGTFTVTGFEDRDNVTVTDLVIPYGYNGKFVTAIGMGAFARCTFLINVTIPDSVTKIDNQAFGGCTSLASVMIGKCVTEIGFEAFSMSGLKSVTIPDSVTKIGYQAFNNCTSLTCVKIGEGVTQIGYNAFLYCTSLANITIPDSVTKIGQGAFYNTEYYNTASNWTGDVLYIGKYLINAKRTISGGYAIQQGTKVIAGGAFNNCDSLTSITIPDGVTEIGETAFNNCDSLTSVTIPDGVTEIGGGTFSGCESLMSIKIPDSVTKIGWCAFSGCEALTQVNISNLAAWCKIDFEDDGSNPLSEARHLYLNGVELTELIIPADIEAIKPYAFYGGAFISVTIPDSMTEIGAWAFEGCTSLTNITIPDSVTEIGGSAFV